jgi:hypothetical protein
VESALFEIYEACSLVFSDHWHSLGLLRDSGSNFFSGSIAPLKNADLSADTVLSISSFVRSGSGSPGSELFCDNGTFGPAPAMAAAVSEVWGRAQGQVVAAAMVGHSFVCSLRFNARARGGGERCGNTSPTAAARPVAGR